MIATVINVVLVLIGSALGLIFRNKISEKFSAALTCALGLCVLSIGIAGAVKTGDTLCVIVCMVVGTLLGELLRIEDRMEGLGEILHRKLKGGKNAGSFAEGFVTASVIFCVGAMAINGSMEAGMLHKYDVLISKGVIDCVTAMTLSAALGIGVAFSALPVLVYQGALTVIFSLVGQAMDPAVINEMSAVGGVIIMGIGINMMGLGKEKLRVGNMLPAIFLPIGYLPLAALLTSLF